MATLDAFNSDAFSVTSLTAAINEVPEGQRVPGIIDDLFDEDGVTSPAVFIEKDNDTLALVPAAQRGAPGDVTQKDKRTAIPFTTLHLPTLGGINADEVLGVRAFGDESEEQVLEMMVDKYLNKMRRRLEATIAFHRIGAIKGQILDADGSTVKLDLFSTFGVTQQTQAMALTTSATKVRDKVMAAKRKAEDVIGDTAMISGWRAICGRGFFDALSSHDNVENTYSGLGDAVQQLLGDVRNQGVTIAGVKFLEYYGKVGSVEFIGTDDAYLIPEGVDDLFITRFAPADYMETVGTMGIPYYAKQEPRAFGKGVDLEAQSNPLNICTKPRAIIKLTKV